MSPRILLFLAIIGTLATVGLFLVSLITSRRRYAAKYLQFYKDNRPPFLRWWFIRNRLCLGRKS